jgi:hypothetical protein
MSSFRAAVLVSLLSFSPLALAGPMPPSGPAKPAPAAERCEHGVKKSICTRCNPKLAPVFKARGDWCAEHGRPETQCVKCHPELAKDGVR